MLTDTHIHFDGLMQADDILDAIVARAAQAGVSHMIAVGGSPAANRTALEIARAYPTRIRAAVGFNRDQTDALGPRETRGKRLIYPALRGTTDGRQRIDNELEAMLMVPEVGAVGEIGLDFHHGRETALAQIELFQRMLLLARDHQLPVIVHTREAKAETLSALREHAVAWHGPADRIGVMHCFTGGEVFARDLLALGFYISFSGIITFKNAESLLAVAALVPDDRLLIETDAPYLAPEPFRGQPNEPANVGRVAEALAKIRHTSWKAIAELTAKNAKRLFGYV